MRCFIAVPCPDGVRERLREVQGKLPPYGKMKLVERENIHLTMKFLGEVGEAKAKEAAEALEGVDAKAFRIEVKGVGAFPNPGHARVIWAGVGEGAAAVTELHRRLEGRINPLGFDSDEKFHPHITLARVKHMEDGEGLRSLIREESGRIYGAYDVQSITLMESRLTPKGPEYTIVTEKRLQ